MKTKTAEWKPEGRPIHDLRFVAKGWQVYLTDKGNVMVAIKPKHVTHSVHVLGDELPSSATDRLWQHINETYPGGSRAG
jgi:hypothetical protein